LLIGFFRYESKGKQFVKNKPTYPIGMSAEYVAAHNAKRDIEASKTKLIPGLVITPETKKKKKKNKNKGVANITEDFTKTSISEQSSTKKQQTSNEKSKSLKEKTKMSNIPTTHETSNKQISTMDPLKRLKNLRKKIREIESLEKKIQKGEIKNPDKEMLEKVLRKIEIQQEIKQLEANQ
jgi:partner of Y14 and mago protein